MQPPNASRFILSLAIASTLVTGNPAHSQQQSLKAQLIGTWGFVVTAPIAATGRKRMCSGPIRTVC